MTAEDARVAVIIPAHNAASTLSAQLAALSSQRTSVSFEIVVVDNGSDDGTATLLKDACNREPRLRVVEANAMKTPGYARNQGVACTTAPLLAFCDADDVVEPGFVEEMARALDEHDVVMGKIDYVALNPPWLQASRGSTAVDRLGDVDGVFPFVVSACLGVRRDAYERVHGFDEHMRVGQDVEFAWRLWQAGIGVGFDDRIVVNYRMRTTAAATFRQARNFGRARMEIRRRMREAGISDVGGIKWRNVLWLIRHLPGTLGRSGRYRWLNVAGNLWGEIRGPAPLVAGSGDV